MKFVTAVVRHHKLDEARRALSALGIQGLTVSEVNGFGRQKGQTEIYRGTEYDVTFVPKVKIEVAVADALLPRTLEALREAVITGKTGDGKIFVSELLHAVRIRTGEQDDSAL